MGTEKGSARITRENKTVLKMISLYCHKHHQHREFGLCSHCAELADFCVRRNERCVFGGAKPTCVKCPVHCYKPAQRERIRVIMRWAGPRMLLHHPILAIRHILDGRKPIPPKPGKHSS